MATVSAYHYCLHRIVVYNSVTLRLSKQTGSCIRSLKLSIGTKNSDGCTTVVHIVPLSTAIGRSVLPDLEQDLRHPSVEAARGSSVFIPNDVGMKNDSRLAIVTGASATTNGGTRVLHCVLCICRSRYCQPQAKAIDCNTARKSHTTGHRTTDLK